MSLRQVVTALNGAGPISKERVLSWMRESDIKTRGAVYVLTNRAWTRITPELSMEEQCSFMASYLIECLVTDPKKSKWVHSGFYAGYEIVAWLKHIRRIPGHSKVIIAVAAQLTRAYKQADDETRNRIETFTLEHVFEDRSLRPFFAEWRDDPEIRDAYDRAIAWGDAHSDT